MATTSAGSRDGRPVTRGRWGLVLAAVLVQLALGAVYAWSVFNKPLQAEFGWSKAEVVLPFEVAIGTIFIGSLVGGRIQDRRGPRPVALGGGILYAVGTMLASLVSSSDQLWLLLLTYGVLGGIGLGAAYITPIAMLSKWFPDKRGLITGIAVAGFGFGAVITAPVAKALLAGTDHKTSVFLPLGIAYLVAVLLGASFFRDPPAGYRVPGFTPAVGGRAVAGTRAYTFGEALRTRQWYLLTLILTLNVTCGIALISQAADAAQAVVGVSAATAAGLVGVLGLFNGGGRVAWAWLSDRIGRMPAFLGMLALQGVCFLILPHAAAFWLFAVLAALVYLAYGGGFGTMPATAADYFGTPNAGAIYGAMIVAWSIGGVVGPLVTALLYDASGKSYTLPFTVIGILAFVALVLPPITRLPTAPGKPRPHFQTPGP
ncbi:OFA family MFS transporter [Micromonospora sp. PPF5-17]|uniref:MFS transporter n=1 Tax=Micromonospora solifontis TaxID=2487138 RepID=A0ABX9WBF7_9ACTN|nr:OFA family MFS transporter [Micromonospora sp. PPF5-17B]NES39793.1 OFA family MFS transporter [Micromonospora solifontis]NES55310.1 OFA family MFS transporter [Micromonospora sp. PPF5-6]RNL85389.1 MFS transporter [Micromonospora solifontis]